jgi:hypothetical protein
MGLLDKLTLQGSPLSKANGGNIPLDPGASPLSKLHDEYSLDGDPNLLGKPQPSELDLNGKVPSYNYKDNAPLEGVGRI